jgi:hypothetical protein
LPFKAPAAITAYLTPRARVESIGTINNELAFAPHQRYHPTGAIMKIEDSSITACLDDSWRTVAQIRGRLGVNITHAGELVSALQRLADAGKIEKTEQETPAPRRRGKRLTGKLSIHFFRRRLDVQPLSGPLTDQGSSLLLS